MRLSTSEIQIPVLRRLTYLGTHPTAARELPKVDVAFEPGCVRFSRRREQLGWIQWRDVRDLSAYSERLPASISRGAIALFGAAGMLVTNRERRLVLRVADRRGAWLFAVRGIKLDELDEGLAVLRRRHGVG